MDKALKEEGTPDCQGKLINEQKDKSEVSLVTEKRNEGVVSPQRHWLFGTMVFFSLSVSIAALAAAAYLYLSTQQQQQLLKLELQQQQQLVISKLQQQKVDLNLAITKPMNKVAVIERQQIELANNLSKIDLLQKQQILLKEQITTLAQRNPNHWMAAEAHYLVKMASRKLWVEQDPVTAGILLKDAENRIASMNDPSFFPIRQAISDDISMLAAIKKTDISSITLELNGVINELPSLSLNRQFKPQKEAGITNKNMTSSVDDWRSNLSKTWHSLVDEIVTVRHRKTDLAPLLLPKEEWYLVENIRLKLLQAQLALYRNEAANYQQSLQMALQWVNQYFDIHSQSVMRVQQQLTKLMSINLKPIAAATFESTQLLNQLTTYGELVAPAAKEHE